LILGSSISPGEAISVPSSMTADPALQNPRLPICARQAGIAESRATVLFIL